MDKPMTGTQPSTPTATTRPQWWTERHTSTWDRVKEALARDWEQTKNDFSSSSGADLNQDVGDTVKQATGSAPLPPSMKTRPDDPKDAAKQAADSIKEQGKARAKVVEAQTDAVVAQVKAQGAVASEQQAAREKIAEAQHQANEKIVEAQKKANEKVADAQQKASEAAAKGRTWNQAEPAVRYGYGARSYYGDAPWDDQLEQRLNTEWTQMRNGSSWNDVRHDVRRGWDAATRNSRV